MLNRSDFDPDGLTSCDGDCDDQDASFLTGVPTVPIKVVRPQTVVPY